MIPTAFSGVPLGYSFEEISLTTIAAATAYENQFLGIGIGAGCEGDEGQVAHPPLRTMNLLSSLGLDYEREFSRSICGDVELPTSNSLLRPAPPCRSLFCAADFEPAIDGLQPQCVVEIHLDGEVLDAVSECVRDDDGYWWRDGDYVR